MERAIVTFKNPEENREITITLDYNKETSVIDYDLKFSDNYSMTSNLDFSGFLAKMFIESLTTGNKEEENKIDE